MNEEVKHYFDITNKFKDISNNLDAIKIHEKREVDLKPNDIKPEPSPDDGKIKLLCFKKGEYQKEYKEGLEQLNNKIKEYKKPEENDEIIKYNKKLDFLEVRIKHDLFNITYRGLDFPPKNDDITPEENSYSNDEDENNKK